MSSQAAWKACTENRCWPLAKSKALPKSGAFLLFLLEQSDNFLTAMTRFWLGIILMCTPVCLFAQTPYPYPYPTIKVCGKKPHQPCITAPKLIDGHAPKYSEEARKNKFQGTVELAFVVDTDGHTRDIHIVNPLGMGLDEEAIAAVESWTFHPGISDGKPVQVPMHVNITFHLL